MRERTNEYHCNSSVLVTKNSGAQMGEGNIMALSRDNLRTMLPGSAHEYKISALPDQGLLLVRHMAGKCAVSEDLIEQRLLVPHTTQSGEVSVLLAGDYNWKFPLPHIAPAHWFPPAMNPHRPWASSRLLFGYFSTSFHPFSRGAHNEYYFDWYSAQGGSSALGILESILDF